MTCSKEERLPSREAFYNSLQQRELSAEEYKHAQTVWEMTSCRTLGDYIKFYCEIDVGLLADVYMKYRSTMQEIYGLDISPYVSLSTYAYGTFLIKNNGCRTWFALQSRVVSSH